MASVTPRTGVGCAGALLLLMIFMAAATLAFSPILWDTWGNVQVVGRLVDGPTGAPAPGARVMTLERASDAGRKAIVDQRWAQGETSAAWTDRRTGASSPTPRPTWLAFGTGVTDEDGRFDVSLRTSWGGNGGVLSRLLGSTDIPPFHGVAALLVRTEAGEEYVLDLTGGRWVVVGARGEGDAYAVLDAGDLQLPEGN
jgi:hypothetical protein